MGQGLADYGTHFPLLAAIVRQITNDLPVLELGCGHFSTPMLHLMCVGQRLVTVETDAQWMSKFTDLKSDTHEFHHVPEDGWDAFTLLDKIRWGVAFVDHKPGDRRWKELRRLANTAEYVVCHDTEPQPWDPDRRGEGFKHYKHRFDYKRYRPWTTVVSNVHDLSWLAR